MRKLIFIIVLATSFIISSCNENGDGYYPIGADNGRRSGSFTPGGGGGSGGGSNTPVGPVTQVDWRDIKVLDENGDDRTSEYTSQLTLSTYDYENNLYAIYDVDNKANGYGIFFITPEVADINADDSEPKFKKLIQIDLSGKIKKEAHINSVFIKNILENTENTLSLISKAQPDGIEDKYVPKGYEVISEPYDHNLDMPIKLPNYTNGTVDKDLNIITQLDGKWKLTAAEKVYSNPDENDTNIFDINDSIDFYCLKFDSKTVRLNTSKGYYFKDNDYDPIYFYDIIGDNKILANALSDDSTNQDYIDNKAEKSPYISRLPEILSFSENTFSIRVYGIVGMRIDDKSDLTDIILGLSSFTYTRIGDNDDECIF